MSAAEHLACSSAFGPDKSLHFLILTSHARNHGGFSASQAVVMYDFVLKSFRLMGEHRDIPGYDTEYAYPALLASVFRMQALIENGILTPAAPSEDLLAATMPSIAQVVPYFMVQVMNAVHSLEHDPWLESLKAASLTHDFSVLGVTNPPDFVNGALDMVVASFHQRSGSRHRAMSILFSRFTDLRCQDLGGTPELPLFCLYCPFYYRFALAYESLALEQLDNAQVVLAVRQALYIVDFGLATCQLGRRDLLHDYHSKLHQAYDSQLTKGLESEDNTTEQAASSRADTAAEYHADSTGIGSPLLHAAGDRPSAQQK
jgi:hypothetical protein